MALEQKLHRWAEAELISPEQVAQILSFEAGHGAPKRPLFLYAVAGLGGLAVALGLLSIVASNWEEISGTTKIILDLLVVAGLGYGIVALGRRGRDWAFEAAALSHYGLILASVALIGQVYQLGGQIHQALAVWTALTAMLMAQTRSTLAAMTWLLGLQLTYCAWLGWVADGPLDNESLAVVGIYWGPLLTLAVGTTPAIARTRPNLAGVCTNLAWAELILCASLGTTAFYDEVSIEAPHLLALGATVGLTAWLWTRLPKTPQAVPMRWLLVTCLALSHIPPLVFTGGLDLLGAITFIGLWVLIAFASYRAGRLRMLNAATAVIGLRLLIVYFEVFGSLLDTGLGLVSGGIVTLVIVWFWAGKRRDFTEELAPTQTPTEVES